MKRKFLVPVVSAISTLLSHQAQAAFSPSMFSNEPSSEKNLKDKATYPFNASTDKTLTELPIISNGHEYLFLMQRSETGVLTAYHRSHSSHSSHSSHRSHYSSR